MVEEVRRDRRVVGITAAMNSGTGLNLLQKAEPEHYFDVGIAEQQAVLFAAGLALEGLKPVCAIYSTFLQRAYDQIIHDVCLQELDVVFAHGPRRPRRRRRPDAPRRLRHRLPAATAEHHAHGPARRGDARAHAAHRAATHDGPVALRYPRGEASACRCWPRRGSRRWSIGRGEVLREGEQGRDRRLRRRRRSWRSRRPTCWPSAGCRVTVADARFAKPLDEELLAQLAAEHELLVTVEEGVLHGRLRLGGVGGAQRAGGAAGSLPRILRVGLPDRYVTHGKPALLHAEVGFTGKAVAQRIEAAVGGRSLAEA